MTSPALPRRHAESGLTRPGDKPNRPDALHLDPSSNCRPARTHPGRAGDKPKRRAIPCPTHSDKSSPTLPHRCAPSRQTKPSRRGSPPGPPVPTGRVHPRRPCPGRATFPVKPPRSLPRDWPRRPGPTQPTRPALSVHASPCRQSSPYPPARQATSGRAGPNRTDELSPPYPLHPDPTYRTQSRPARLELSQADAMNLADP